MTLYLFLKWLHVLGAIVAVGSNLTYFVWLRLGSRSSSSMKFALTGIKFLDDRIAMAGYAVLVVTGLLMVWVNRLPLLTPWIIVPIVLLVVVSAVAAAFFSPSLQRQITLVDSPGPYSVEYKSVSRRVIVSGAVISVLVVAITFLMVIKPPLWG